MLLVPLPSRVGRNLTAARRCGTTTPANSSDGRSGYCAPPASGQLPGNQHGKTTEERREGGSTPQKDKPDALPRELERDARGGWVTRRSGLLALWPSGSDTGSCLLFTDTEPLVELSERPRKPKSSRHATSPVTAEACIIAHDGRATLSPAPANCVLLLLSLVLLPVRSCPSARAEDLTCLRLCSWRQGGVFSHRKMPILRSRFHRVP